MEGFRYTRGSHAQVQALPAHLGRQVARVGLAEGRLGGAQMDPVPLDTLHTRTCNEPRAGANPALLQSSSCISNPSLLCTATSMMCATARHSHALLPAWALVGPGEQPCQRMQAQARGCHLGEEDVLQGAAGLLEGLDHGGQHVSDGHVAVGRIACRRPHIYGVT